VLAEECEIDAIASGGCPERKGPTAGDSDGFAHADKVPEAAKVTSRIGAD
jgi:hypothetical protein